MVREHAVEKDYLGKGSTIDNYALITHQKIKNEVNAERVNRALPKEAEEKPKSRLNEKRITIFNAHSRENSERTRTLKVRKRT